MSSNAERQEMIEQIRQFPARVEALVTGLTEAERTTASLPGEWTVAQNVHHLVDSHLNSYIRCKLMATEENPTLKPYDEKAWAQFPDAGGADLSDSLALLRALHARWAVFWETLPPNAWERSGYHPESGPVTLDGQLRTYVAHGESHLDQIAHTLAAQKRP